MVKRAGRARKRPVRAHVGLGSNLGNPVARVEAGLRALGDLSATHLVARSSLFRSRPLIDDGTQPLYINAVAVIETALGAHALLRALQGIEDAQGRDRRVGRWASRTLDLDLLVYGRQRQAGTVLVLPHPEIARREFVLYPLLEVDPRLEIPGLGPVAELVRGCDPRGLERLEEVAT